jgi:hypothetical protein
LTPEELVALVGQNMAMTIPGLRASARSHGLLGRVQLLLLVFALVNLFGALVVVAASGASPLILYSAGLAAPLVLAVVWFTTYQRRDFGLPADIAAIAAICVLAMAVDARWNNDVAAVLTAAVFFGSTYGSMSRVLIRTGLLSAVSLGQGLSDPTSFTMACGFAV